MERRAQGGQRAALAAALLLLPRRGASEREMLEAIVGLSYGGDVRMAVGAEAEGKVGAIAEGSREPMREMYAPHLAALQEAGLLSLTADAEAEDACGVERDVSVAAEALAFAVGVDLTERGERVGARELY